MLSRAGCFVVAHALMTLCFTAAQPREVTHHFSNRTGIISSPNYPQNYSNNHIIRWHISASTPMMFSLNLTAFDIEYSIGCKNDYLKVSRDFGGRALSLSPIVCGREIGFENSSKTFSWLVMANQIHVELKTDVSVTSRGFVMEYSVTEVDSDSLCSAMRAGGVFQGTISSSYLGNRGSLPANVNCSWEVDVPPGRILEISVRRFEMEYFGESCEKDRFSISTISRNEEELLGTYCGRRNSWRLAVKDSNSVKLSLVTDSTDNHGGLLLYFYQILPEEYAEEVGPHLVRIHGAEKKGLPVPPKWSSLTPKAVTFLWHLRADPGFRITVSIHAPPSALNLSLPFIFYDGPDTSIRVRSRFRLTSKPVNKTSSGFHAVLAVTLKRLNLIDELNITYETFNYFLSEKILFRYLGVGDTTYIRNPSQIFRCCAYHALVGRRRETIAFDLVDLNLFTNMPNDRNCSSAGVVIFDGGFSASQMIGPICDTTDNRLFEIFNNFVTSSSTVFVFLYGYTNGVGRTRSPHELDAWATSCSVEHFNEARLRQSSGSYKLVDKPGLVIAQPTPLRFDINYTRGKDDCLMVYIHSWDHEEPSLHLNVYHPEATFTSLCHRWSMSKSSSYNDDFRLPQNTSKYSQQWSCGFNNASYLLQGNEASTWSQRLGRLTVGDVPSHICAKVPKCTSQYLIPLAPCGIIYHEPTDCSWALRTGGSSEPHYWEIEILILSSELDHLPQCHLEIVEVIGGLKTQMVTRMMCRDFNSGRLRRYRTMEPNSYMILSNRNTRTLKLTYAKKSYNDDKLLSFPDNYTADSSTNCPNGSVLFQDFCYRFARSNSSMSWKQGQETCQENGSHLVSVTTRSELDFIKHSLLTVWNSQFFRTPLGPLFIGLNDITKPNSYRWTDGNPMSFSDWYHAWDKDHNILPYLPDPPIARKFSQPVPFKSRRCVAMVIGNVYYSTNWIKIPCSEAKTGPSYICKSPASTRDDGLNVNRTVRMDSTANHSFVDTEIDTSGEGTVTYMNPTPGSINSSTEICPGNFSFVHGHCYSLISEDIRLLSDTPRAKALSLCQSMGAEVASVIGISPEIFLKNFKLWGIRYGDGNVWIRTIGGHIGCTSLSTLAQQSAGLNTSEEGCILNEGRTGFVLCEAKPVPVLPSCRAHHYTCNDGSCVHGAHVCDGHSDCPLGEDELSCPANNDDLLFICDDGSKISASYMCDFWPDCADRSDESGCRHRPCLVEEFRCRNRQCIPRRQKCDFKTHCLDGSDEVGCDWGIDECQGFLCPGGECLPYSRVHDIIPDCPENSEADELSPENFRLTFYYREAAKYVRKNDYSAMCHGTILSRRCHRDHQKCFNRANVCTYDLDEQGDLMFCRDGAHLTGCEDFQCPHMFKCPQSYCVPWHRVCDRSIDCPGGADEQNCGNYSCPGRLRCRGSTQCVTENELCDGRVHCIDSPSDEQFCDLGNFHCPSNCSCQGYTVDCRGANLLSVPLNISLNVRSFLLQNNQVTLKEVSFSKLSYLHVLRLTSNGISSIPKGTFLSLVNLRTLDLRQNEIHFLYANIFRGLVSLTELLLDGNPLMKLPSKAFWGLESMRILNVSGLGVHTVESAAVSGVPRLHNLDLSYNNISVLEPGFLSANIHMDNLYLNGNDLEGTGENIFGEVAAKKMFTDSYRFCCFVGTNVDECYPNSDAFSSCQDLLSTTVLRAFVWALGVACIVGNTIVIFWRIYSGVRNRPSVYVVNLAISDSLMGIYLIILASFDTYYRGNYIWHDLEWRRGGVCKLLGILATVSCQMSMFTLLALAWDRFITVTFPFAVSMKTVRGAYITMAVLWVFTVLLAVMPLASPDLFDEFYSRNSVCMPFNFSEPRSKGWEYSLAIFVGLNGVCLIVMIALYGVIYCQVRESQMTVGRTDRSDLVVARRLSIVLITNIISWIPVILANIIAVSVSPLTREMAAILTTVILPLNPAINPYLYTFSSCIKRDSKNVQKSIPISMKSAETHL